jgi:uncharacterized protein
MSDQVKMMEHVVSLDYERPLTLATRQYLDAIRDQRIIGQRCPSCDRIFTPPRGYCPICTVQTGKEHEVELPSTGTLVSFTVLNPDSLHVGEESTCRGTVLLDGEDAVTMTGDLTDVKPDDAHVGIRLRAVFSSPSDEEAAFGAGWGGFGISGWARTGEPDVPADEVKRMSTGGGI